MTPQGRLPATSVSDNGSQIADHPQGNRPPDLIDLRGWHPQAPPAPGACVRQIEGHAPQRRRILLRRDLARDDGAARAPDALVHRPPKLIAHRDATPPAPWPRHQNVPQVPPATVAAPRSVPVHRGQPRVCLQASATADPTAPATAAAGPRRAPTDPPHCRSMAPAPPHPPRHAARPQRRLPPSEPSQGPDPHAVAPNHRPPAPRRHPQPASTV
jgi:hypothetical protein